VLIFRVVILNEMKDLFFAFWIDQNHSRSFTIVQDDNLFSGLAEESTYSGFF
jgi:hypothetical protein